jgi:hypothetical protein
MVKIAEKIKNAPEKKRITTLDGQHVEVKEFIDYCNHHFPDCILYEKFYYWETSVENMVSQTSSGLVSHPARFYYNPFSICLPSKVNPGRTHGDVVELYDGNGKFMGIAVYMGESKYFSIPFSGNTK